jgi:lactoylglutathione lyase
VYTGHDKLGRGTVELAKPHVDLGLFTDDLEPMLRFWQQEVGLPFEETLPTGRGMRQHRLGMHGSVLKINDRGDPLPSRPASGYRELRIARDGLAGVRALSDPDGNRLALVPLGDDGVVGIGVHLAVSDPEAHHRFYRETLELEPCGSDAYRCGDSVLSFEADPAAKRGGDLRGPGFRYITIQVRDVDAEHLGILERGGEEGLAPRTLGKVARISFVCDPDGNWIEISQRASLTGPLD